MREENLIKRGICRKVKKMVNVVAYGVLVYKLYNSVKLTYKMVALK